MNTPTIIAASVGAIALAVGGGVAATQIDTFSSTTVTTTTVNAKGCNDWPKAMTDGECIAAGAILASLSNIQPAAQFCKWRAANPGEWNRLSGYASTGTQAATIVTWLGGSIFAEIQAYFGTGAPTFSLPRVPLPPNSCGAGKLLAPPSIQGVTPGETSVTVTVGP